MNNSVLAVENLLRPAPTPKTATFDTPNHPFPSIETEPKTHDQPAKSHDITPDSIKKPDSHPANDKKTANNEHPSTDQLTTVPQSAVNPESVPKPTAEAEEPTEAQLKSQSPVISTTQLQQQAMPGPSEAKGGQPAQPQLLQETAASQPEQKLIQQEVTEETAKAASSSSPVVPDARQDPKEAMPNVLTPLTKETTVPTATIMPTVKPQAEDKQPQIVSFDGVKNALANEQTVQQGQPTLTGNSAGRNPLGQQVSAEQTKRMQKGNAENASGLDIERLLSQHEAQPRFTRPITTPAASAGKSAQAPSPPVQLPSPAEQIIESIHSMLSRESATRQIIIRLNPPELGKISVQFEQHEDHITGLLKVATLQTRHEVEQAAAGNSQASPRCWHSG